MTDTRLAESFLTNIRLDGLSDKAHRIYTNALVYSVSRGTDGFVLDRALRLLHPDGIQGDAVTELVDAGLWIDVTDGWLIRNFLRYQTSAEQVAKQKELARLRKKKERDKKLETDLQKAGGDDHDPGSSRVTGRVTNGVGLLGQDSDRSGPGQAAGRATAEEAEDDAYDPATGEYLGGPVPWTKRAS